MNKKLLFNRNPVTFGGAVEQPPNDLVKNTLGLWRCSLEDAVKFGGDLTRAVLSNVPLKNDRKYVFVDTKIHMLMPGMCPAIPGYHTDAVPRSDDFKPSGKGKPNIWLQEHLDARAPRMHLLVTGQGCLTDFVDGPLELDIPIEPTTDLYALMTKQVESIRPKVFTIPSCQWVSWDWWDIHTAVTAKVHEWRYLIRVTETDYQSPQTDLREILRTQQNVYVPQAYGW